MATLTGTATDDTLGPRSTADILIGLSGADILNGGPGNDLIYTDQQSGSYTLPYFTNDFTAPTLDQGSDADTVNGGTGDDVIFAGFGDTVDGGLGTDRLLISFAGASAGITADFRLLYTFNGGILSVGGATISSIENVDWIEGSNYADVIWADAPGTTRTAVFGLGGDDLIYAGYYTGHVYGGDGNDTLDLTNGPYGFPAYGEDGDDIILGGYNGETLYGGAGNDRIDGGGGFDDLFGGAGDDVLDLRSSSIFGAAYGGSGGDIIYGRSDSGQDADLYSYGGEDGLEGDGADTGTEIDEIYGSGGADKIYAGIGDIIDGDRGNDTLSLTLGFQSGGTYVVTPFVAGSGNLYGTTYANIERLAELRFSEFDDVITTQGIRTTTHVNGGGGNDVFYGTQSAEYWMGGTGDDTFHFSGGADIIVGGEGIDTLDLSQATGRVITVGIGIYNRPEIDMRVSVLGEPPILAGGVEHIIGSAFNDRITGTIVEGGAGDDYLTSYYSAGSYSGGDGNDTIRFDSAYALNDAVHASGGAGNDRITNTMSSSFSTVVVNMHGDDGNDWISGGFANDIIFGDAGDDVLAGGGGDDHIYGGAGRDFMSGNRLNYGTYYDHDVFHFADGDFSGTTYSTADRITDFIGNYDKIDLSAVDADVTISGDQAFVFIGAADFSGTAGELRFHVGLITSMIYGDTDGDGVADFAIALTGATSLSLGDLVL